MLYFLTRPFTWATTWPFMSTGWWLFMWLLRVLVVVGPVVGFILAVQSGLIGPRNFSHPLLRQDTMEAVRWAVLIWFLLVRGFAQWAVWRNLGVDPSYRIRDEHNIVAVSGRIQDMAAILQGVTNPLLWPFLLVWRLWAPEFDFRNKIRKLREVGNDLAAYAASHPGDAFGTYAQGTQVREIVGEFEGNLGFMLAARLTWTWSLPYLAVLTTMLFGLPPISFVPGLDAGLGGLFVKY